MPLGWRYPTPQHAFEDRLNHVVRVSSITLQDVQIDARILRKGIEEIFTQKRVDWHVDKIKYVTNELKEKMVPSLKAKWIESR